MSARQPKRNSLRVTSADQIDASYERTPAEVTFAQRYLTAGPIVSTFERTPAELDFAQRYLSAGQIDASYERTPAELNLARQFGATEEQLPGALQQKIISQSTILSMGFGTGKIWRVFPVFGYYS